jgi:hypothetical protein
VSEPRERRANGGQRRALRGAARSAWEAVSSKGEQWAEASPDVPQVSVLYAPLQK